MFVPIELIPGLLLEPLSLKGIARAKVLDAAKKSDLSWDRYVRLKRAAEAVAAVPFTKILDAGGYDGAIALFLPQLEVDVIDPATTGGSILDIPVDDDSYDAVVAIDVLEHIEPKQRSEALSEFARVARSHIILNYPSGDSKEAQELVLKLTNNSLIREHVEWALPDSDWVLDELAKYGYRGSITPHTSIAVWLGQYVTLNLLPDVAQELNRHLVSNYADEPTSKSLYHLVVCARQ